MILLCAGFWMYRVFFFLPKRRWGSIIEPSSVMGDSPVIPEFPIRKAIDFVFMYGEIDMDYKEFLNAVVDEIGDYLLDCDFEDVSVRPIEKNNGVLLQGLMLRKKDAPVAPNIYMEYYYSMYESGASMETVLAEIAAEYQRASSVLSGRRVCGLFKGCI